MRVVLCGAACVLPPASAAVHGASCALVHACGVHNRHAQMALRACVLWCKCNQLAPFPHRPLSWPPCVQDQNGQPQPALGTHRLWAAEAVALLLLSAHASIDAAVADAGLLPQLVCLALQLDKANVLHCRVLRMLQCSLHSSVPRLWAALFEPAAAAGAAADGGADGSGQLLHAALVALGESERSPAEAWAFDSASCACGMCCVLHLSCTCGMNASTRAAAPAHPHPHIASSTFHATLLANQLDYSTPVALCLAGSQASGVPVGMRPARIGFAAEAAQVLLMSSDPTNPDYFNEQLRDMLAVRAQDCFASACSGVGFLCVGAVHCPSSGNCALCAGLQCAHAWRRHGMCRM